MHHIRFFFCSESHKVLHQTWDDVLHKQDYFQRDPMKDHSRFYGKHVANGWQWVKREESWQ